jgi:hypothetical protein
MSQIANVEYVHTVINVIKPGALSASTSKQIATMRYVAAAIDQANGGGEVRKRSLGDR